MTVLRSFLALMLAMMLVRLRQLFGSYKDARGAAHGFCEYIASRISDRSCSVVKFTMVPASHGRGRAERDVAECRR